MGLTHEKRPQIMIAYLLRVAVAASTLPWINYITTYHMVHNLNNTQLPILSSVQPILHKISRVYITTETKAQKWFQRWCIWSRHQEDIAHLHETKLNSSIHMLQVLINIKNHSEYILCDNISMQVWVLKLCAVHECRPARDDGELVLFH